MPANDTLRARRDVTGKYRLAADRPARQCRYDPGAVAGRPLARRAVCPRVQRLSSVLARSECMFRARVGDTASRNGSRPELSAAVADRHSQWTCVPGLDACEYLSPEREHRPR